MEFHQQRWKGNRSGGEGTAGYAFPSGSLSRADGTENVESRRCHRNDSNGAPAIREDGSCRQVQNGRILPTGICRSASSPIGKQTPSSSSSCPQNDVIAGAVLDRRELDSCKQADLHGRTTLGSLGNPRLGGHSAPVCVQPPFGTNMGGCLDQSAEGGGLIKEKRTSSKPEAAWKRRWQGQGQQGEGCQRVRGHRFLRWQPLHEIKKSPLDRDSTDCFSWLKGVVYDIRNSDLNLGCYVRSTFEAAPNMESKTRRKGADMFPCPPPYPWTDAKNGCSRRSSRSVARWKVRRSVELWVNLMVCVLSQQALDCRIAPPLGRRGCPLSQSQFEMVSKLGTFAKSVIRLGSDPGCGLRLPAAADRVQHLREQFEEFSQLPYACGMRVFGKGDSNFAATQALPVVADRLSLPSEVQDFNPIPFLSPLFRKIYETPDEFLKNPDEMPDRIRIKGTATRAEMLKVFQRWDLLNRLHICRADQVNPDDRCEIFAVAKDAEKDRQILHRKRRNRREQHFAGASQDLPHGVLLCQLPLEDRFVCVSSVDDLKDFYHAYPASEARARSTPVGPVFGIRDVRHLKACQDALKANRITHGDPIVCCFQGLGMGDHAAVDIAQESHVNVIRSFGGLDEKETLSYKHPLPLTQTGFYEGIMIDDHLGIQLLEKQGTLRDTLAQPGRDQEAFAAAERAYETVGLQAHPSKRKRRVLDVKVWGAELEGGRGLVGPSRSRLLRLARLTSEVAKPGPVDEKIVEAITGLWAYCAQFRRPLFSFMHSIYRQKAPVGKPQFRLSRDARDELISLACLAPLCLNDLTVFPDDWIYCVDASPSGAGCCRAFVGRNVSRELWRRSDKQGYRIPLMSCLEASLKGAGWNEEDVFDFLATDELDEDQAHVDTTNSLETSRIGHKVREDFSPLPSLPDVPFDFLEMYAGCARMSESWRKEGFRVMPPLELKEGWDLFDGSLFWGLLRLIQRKQIRFLWFAPPCTTYSLARTPKLRSLKQPWGFHLLDRDTLVGNLHACQALLLAAVQALIGHWFGGEQPAFGFMRALDIWVFLVFLGADEILFDWCRYDQPFRKTTRLVSNCEALKELAVSCNHSHGHEPLKGAATTRAGAYSKKFCDRVAEICRRVWKWNDPPMSDTDELFEPPKRRKPASALWAVQLSESLCWKPFMQYRFREQAHINLQESKARRSVIKRLKPNRRVVMFQDSRVNLGSLGKGRSPADSLNRIMRREAPYLLGKNLYLAGAHMPTWSIRADGPSRFRPIDPPRIAIPSWFWKLSSGSDPDAGSVHLVEGLPRSYARWHVLVGALLLDCRGGSAPPGHSTCQNQRATLAGSHDGKDSEDSGQFASGVRKVAFSPDWSSDLGEFGPEAHRRFVRLFRRLYGAYVRHPSVQAGSSRNAQHGGATVWVAQILACRALEHHSSLGRPGTTYSPSTAAFANSSCSCGLCTGLAMAQAGGPPGPWVFCFVETCRIYWLATSRPESTRRSFGTGRGVRAGRIAQNSVSISSQSTCASRRTGHRFLDCVDASLHTDVSAYLEWLIGRIQKAVRPIATKCVG